MPLTGDPSKDIPELIRSGHPQKQAEAIALKEQRERKDADPSDLESRANAHRAIGRMRSSSLHTTAYNDLMAAARFARRALDDPKWLKEAERALELANRTSQRAYREEPNGPPQKTPQAKWDSEERKDEQGPSMQDRLDALTETVHGLTTRKDADPWEEGYRHAKRGFGRLGAKNPYEGEKAREYDKGYEAGKKDKEAGK